MMTVMENYIEVKADDSMWPMTEWGKVKFPDPGVVKSWQAKRENEGQIQMKEEGYSDVWKCS